MTYDPFYDEGRRSRRGCLGLLLFGPGAFVIALALAGARQAAQTVGILWVVVTAAWLVATQLVAWLDRDVDADTEGATWRRGGR